MNQNDNPDFENLEEELDDEEEEELEEEEEAETVEEEEEEDKPQTTVQKDDDPRIPEKFKGKTAAEIAEAYTNLESLVNTRAIEIAKGLMDGKMPSKEAIKNNEKEEDDFGLTEEELKNMTPKQFLAHVNKTITERAQKIVSDTMARTTEVRSAVKKDVAEATKAHPHLKTNKAYRDVVIDMIDAAQARGTKLTLKEACKKADEAMGIKVEPAKPEVVVPKKKPRTGVEKVQGTDGEPVLDEEEKVKAGILGAGARVGLGGL